MLGLTLISTSNHLWLEFYSDEESTGEGFKLVYSSEYTELRNMITSNAAFPTTQSSATEFTA